MKWALISLAFMGVYSLTSAALDHYERKRREAMW